MIQAVGDQVALPPVYMCFVRDIVKRKIYLLYTKRLYCYVLFWFSFYYFLLVWRTFFNDFVSALMLLFCYDIILFTARWLQYKQNHMWLAYYFFESYIKYSNANCRCFIKSCLPGTMWYDSLESNFLLYIYIFLNWRRDYSKRF